MEFSFDSGYIEYDLEIQIMARKSGSATARGGFANEDQVANAFNAGNSFARKCLAEMNIPTSAVVVAQTVPAKLGKASVKRILQLASTPTSDQVNAVTKQQKADIRLQYAHEDDTGTINLSLKKANANANFNQVDKRKIDTYQEFWGFDNEIRLWLRVFTGAANKAEFEKSTDGLTIDEKRQRVVFKNLPDDAKQKIINFITANKRRIISDVVRGSGLLAADYLMVTQRAKKSTKVHLCAIDDMIEHLSVGPVEEGPRGALRLGRLTMQRYGGSPHPELLQFKLKPSDALQVKGLTQSVVIKSSKK